VAAWLLNSMIKNRTLNRFQRPCKRGPSPGVERAGASGNKRERTTNNDSSTKEREVPVLTLPLAIGYWLHTCAASP